MGYKFNPFTGNLDEVSAGGGGGGTPGGSDTQVQYNNAGSFGGSADLTWNDTAKELGVGGDINLDDGGTYTTTLQTITPTANRTVSIPDATGTVALVAGSSGQLVYNNAGAYAGASGSSVGATGDITLSLNGAASTPPLKLTGTWFSGGTATTTKPQFLIEPAGTTSTAWSTSGTGLGVNAASGFSGNLLDLQVNGTSKFEINSNGEAVLSSTAYSSNKVLLINSHNNSPVIAVEHGGGFQNLSSCRIKSLSVDAISVGTVSPHPSNFRENDAINFAGDLVLLKEASNTLAQRKGTNAQTYRLYNTYTDANNYQRTSITDDSTGLVIDQQYAGTGAARTNLLDLKVNGASRVTATKDAALFLTADTAQSTNSAKIRLTAGNGNYGEISCGNTTEIYVQGIYHRSLFGVRVGSSSSYGWSTGGTGAQAADTALARDQAGVVAITNGSTGTGYLKQTPVTVGNLPAAATVGAGTRGFVSDSTVAASGNFGATVTGGGSNNVPVFSDGTNWLIG